MNYNINKSLNFKTISQLRTNFNLKNNTINILFCDVQDKYIPKIACYKELIQKVKLISSASKILNFNQIVTEQKKQIFGTTIPEITNNLNSSAKIFEKTRFAMFSEEEIEKMNETDVNILVGVETHICVYQTAFNFLKMNRHIIILADVVSSSNLGERKVALENLKDMGAYITTCQGLLFLILEDSENENFKPLVKILAELSGVSYDLLLDGVVNTQVKF